MYVAGVDAHGTYLVVAIVSNDGELVQKPMRIGVARPEEPLTLLFFDRTTCWSMLCVVKFFA